MIMTDVPVQITSDEDDDIYEFSDLELVVDSEVEENEEEAPVVLYPASTTFNKHQGSVFSCSINPASENLVATGGEDDMCYLWDIKTGEEVLAIHNHSDSVTHVLFNHDGSLLATADMQGKLQVFSVATKVKMWDTDISDLYWAVWHHCANVLFAGTQLGYLYMWRIPSGDVKILRGTGAHVNEGVLMPDGKRLCLALVDGTMKVVDLKSMSERHRQSVHVDSVTSLTALHDNILVFSGSIDGKAKLFNTNTGKVVSTFTCSDNGEEPVELVNLSMDPGFPVGVTSTLYGTLQFWDLPTQTERDRLKMEDDEGVVVLDWRSGNSHMYGATLHGRILLIDARTSNVQRSWKLHSEAVLDMSISSDGKTIVTASEDGSCCVLNIE